MQEENGSFGPRVSESMFHANNLYVTCTNSGKLNRQKVQEFINSIITPNVGEKILYVIDKWSGQKNPKLYANLFVDGENELHIKFVPEHCTDICQPLHTYLHRQLKYLTKQFYSHEIKLLKENEKSQLISRNGILKMQSLIYYILSAPVFESMIKYCWLLSGL